ncbi:MAG: hypothetical protein HY054_16010 [Proteobacteria bacterium]|nr:hypothetical protein [Pseudomonadota bacterium]
MNLANDGALAAAVLLLNVIALGVAVAALRTRALFVAGVCVSLLTTAVCAALLISGAVVAAIALTACGAALLPVWSLGGALLSGNAVKAGRRRVSWLALGAVVGAIGLVAAVVPDLTVSHARVVAEPQGLPVLLSALMFVAALSAVALIGYGERGALDRRGQGAP